MTQNVRSAADAASGSRASHEAASASSPKASIPNAGVFLKRALAVDAWRFANDADSYNLLHWINQAQSAAGRPFARWINSNIIIPTLEGEMAASVGDWIIRGVKGEFYPCKPDVFETIYDRVGDLVTVEETPNGN